MHCSITIPRLFWGAALFFFFACGEQESGISGAKKASGPALFEQLDPKNTGVSFANSLNESKEMNYLNFNYLYMSGGAAAGDFDNDGLPDLYFAATMGPVKLYRNKGNFQFDDLSDKAGLEAAATGIKTGVALVDINGDGWLDIYQCRTGASPAQRGNLLFINNKNLTFTESSAAYGLDARCPSTQATFFDYDLDGDLDLYLLNHPDDFAQTSNVRLKEAGGKQVRITEPDDEYTSDRLYRNNGNGTFTDISKQAGIQNFAFGLSATTMDVNTDGYPDIYVANDYIEPDILYINNRNGTFSDRTNDYIRHMSAASMGADWADINNDALPDLFVLDMALPTNKKTKNTITSMVNERYYTLVQYGYGEQMMRNMLQLNNGNGTFSEIGCLAGVSATDWSWSPLLVDFDNDGWRDIFISNGFRREVTNLDYIHFVYDSTLKANGGVLRDTMEHIKVVPKDPVSNYMYRNRGDLTFEDVSEAWGFGEKTFSNAAIYADFDNDGDQDIVVVRPESPSAVFKNKTVENKQGNYLQIKLEGNPQNPFGVGATVWVQNGSQTQIAYANPVRGFISTSTDILQFGLGAHNGPVEVRVQWPDGKVQSLENVSPNQRLTLKQTDAQKGPSLLKPAANNAELFTEISEQSGLNLKHRENLFFDFDRERLLPRKYSNLGPALTRGDVNGDGLDDLYLGGCFGGVRGLCIQGANGKFSLQTGLFSTDSLREDIAAAFFDADGDKDLDLYIVSGGNEAKINSPNYQDRLYLNDGKGKMSPAPAGSLPAETESGGCVTPFDYDKDGDLDLFVGGRTVPGNYPKAPFSFVFKNDGKGSFSKVTTQVAPELEQIGMVTALIFADLDKDGQEEMLVAGEWMAIEVFKLTNGKFTRATQQFGLENIKGWWNCLIAADFDGDGDLDLVAGNEGLNTRYRATQEAPIRMYAKDFDNNGSMDPLMSWYENGIAYPVALRDPLIKQIPALKKKFVRYGAYAEATMEDVYPMSTLKLGIVLEVNELRSCYFENNGGKFSVRPLPVEAQCAPAKSLIAEDFNGDGTMDLLLAGNDYGPAVETNRYDAGNGCLLLGEGKGNFRYMPNRQSGFWAMREARNLALVKMANGKQAVVLTNNSSTPQVFLTKTKN
jgi:hypothetical protein